MNFLYYKYLVIKVDLVRTRKAEASQFLFGVASELSSGSLFRLVFKVLVFF